MKKYSSLALTVMLAATLGACDDPIGQEAGTISMYLTDAPGDFTRAIVTIDRIELLRGDDEDDDETQGGRVVLMDTPWTGDLLELSNDVAELVEDEAVPGGSWSQLRLIISGGCIEVETEAGSDVYASGGYTECGAADGTLQMPSFAQSGLKIKLPSGFRVSGDHTILLVDFDVSQSFGHQAGNSGMWVMHPVVHATEIVLSGNLDVAVTVADSVTLPDELTVDDLTLRLGEEPPVAVVDGVASFRFLLPGSYTIDLVQPDGVQLITDPTMPIEIDIGSGQDADIDITITGVI